MSLITRVTRSLRVGNRTSSGRDLDLLQALATVEDELDLCCTFGRSDPARGFIRQRLEFVVRVFNVEGVIPFRQHQLMGQRAAPT